LLHRPNKSARLELQTALETAKIVEVSRKLQIGLIGALPKAARLAKHVTAGMFISLLLLGTVSCQSDKPAGRAPFAEVVLTGNTPGQIRNATVAVFADNGYKTRRSDPGEMVFEKEGSRMNNFAYGSWMGDTPVWVRVKATVTPVGEMKCRLECRPYLVRDIGSAAEQELSVSTLHRGPYQKLLDEVAKRLSGKG